MAGDGLLRRLRRRRIDPEGLIGLPDSHPKRGLIAEPVRVARLEHEVAELPADRVAAAARTEGVTDADDVRRVTFLLEVRSADDARCPNIAVEVRIGGPDRERTVSGATDMLGRVRFRMTGGPGTYRCEVRDVAAGGLDWDRSAGPTELSVDIGAA